MADFDGRTEMMLNREKINLRLDGLRLGRLSHERLWELAFRGDRRALDLLYERSWRLWLKFIPVDRTGLLTEADWQQVAALRFAEKWKSFDPKFGIRWSTWSCRVIANQFISEIRSLNTNKRRIGSQIVNESQVENINNLLVQEFAAYSDELMVTSLLARFRDHLQTRVAPEVLSIYDLKLWASDIGVRSLSRLAHQSVVHVRQALRCIREEAIAFGQRERTMRYADISRVLG